MEEKDFERIEKIVQREMGTLSEDFQHKLDIVVEGHQMLNEKIDRMDERLCGKIDRLDDRLSGKIDAVAKDLAEHRRDTEAHKGGYKAGEE